MTFEHVVQLGWLIFPYFGAVIALIAVIRAAPYFMHPSAQTEKARDIALGKAEKEMKIASEGFAKKLAAIALLPLSSQADALAILKVEMMTKAPDWKFFGLGAGTGFLQNGVRVIAEADVLFQQVQQSEAWPKIKPLLEMAAQKAGLNASDTPIFVSASTPESVVPVAIPAKGPTKLGPAPVAPAPTQDLRAPK